MNESDLRAGGWVKRPDGSWDKWNSPRGLAPAPVSQPSPGNEPVAEDPRSHRDKIRRLVRITSFRTRECDERNLFDKYFTDALVHAGLLFDDTPRWCKVEVEQKPVAHKWEQRTEIEITPLD